MKNKAIKYLTKNPLLHMGMLETIRRGTADILYAEENGVLLKEDKSNAYMLSVDNFDIGKELINTTSSCNLILSHQEFMVDYILDRFNLTKKLECFQAVYMDKAKLSMSEELEMRQLNKIHVEIILEHYGKLSKSELETILEDGNLFGGYNDGELIGFIGNHLEGSMGLLEIFPKYRRLGYGTILESYMINHMLEKDLVPFAQIEVDNNKSLALHNKLGFSVSRDSLFWIF
jgi:ribosomal protein S18 acetylase RimI-like enzyme